MVTSGDFSFSTALGGSIRLRIDRQGNPSPNLEQQSQAREAARQIRLGVSWGSAPILRVVQELHQALHGDDAALVLGGVDAGLGSQSFLDTLVNDIERQLEIGRLVVVAGALPLLEPRPEPQLTEREELPQLPPPPQQSPVASEQLTFYEVRFIDEVGEAIGGVEVEMVAGALQELVTTNPAGIATLEDVQSMSGSVGVVDVKALGELLVPRWETKRKGSAPRAANTKTFVFTGAKLEGVGLKPAIPNTIVLQPPLGKLFVELWDKSGRLRHGERDYTISGPESFSGTTDEQGRLLHEDVLPGDYQLSISIDDEDFECPLLVLGANATSPQVRRVAALPYVQQARLFGMLFETDKNFLLPSALPSLREIRKLYEASNPSELLIVGHTDTTGDPSYNDVLSLERADAVAAYLQDDVDTWLDRYELSVVEKKRWGDREDLLMITAMPDFPTKPEQEEAVRWFQRTRNLEMDGIAGPKTREQLVKEYMRLDGVTLADESDFDISITTHGCGENFPLDDSGKELDTAPGDDEEDAKDRRVELFFFDKEFGIQPPPPGKNSPPGGAEYPEWRKRAEETLDFDTDDSLEATCHFSFVLNDEATEKPREFAIVRFEPVPGVPVAVQTDHTGLLEFGDLVPGDYELDVDGLTITVSALPKEETKVPLLLRSDPEQA